MLTEDFNFPHYELLLSILKGFIVGTKVLPSVTVSKVNDVKDLQVLYYDCSTISLLHFTHHFTNLTGAFQNQLNLARCIIESD